MGRKTRVPRLLIASVVLLPILGMGVWFLYDSSVRDDTEASKPTANVIPAPASLEVSVTATGKPARNAAVAVHLDTEAPRLFTRRTNDDGVAEFDHLPNGRYVVMVIHPPYARAKRRVELDAAPESLQIALETAKPRPPTAPGNDEEGAQEGTIRGRLENAEGKPISKAKVAVAASGGIPKFVQPSADGSFRFTGLKPGSVELTVSAPGYAQAEQQKVDVGSSDVVVVVQEAATVSGELSVSGPSEKLEVKLCRPKVPNQKEDCPRARSYRRTPKRYELNRAPPGKFDLVFFKGEKELARVPIVIEPGESVEVPAQRL
jgi:hypothetical protein